MSNRRQTETDRQTMSDASHTNPYTGESFGETVAYSRGRVVAADGGRADANESDGATVKDMDHTPRMNAPGAAEVYERGGEADE
jgi:hypothetical protein